MFGLSFMEIVVVCSIALIVLGPEQLPKVARSLGRLLNELKRASQDLSGSFMSGDRMSNFELKRELESVREKLEQSLRSEPEHPPSPDAPSTNVAQSDSSDHLDHMHDSHDDHEHGHDHEHHHEEFAEGQTKKTNDKKGTGG